MTREHSENRLVQESSANYLHDNLGWESVYSFNDEILGGDVTRGQNI